MGSKKIATAISPEIGAAKTVPSSTLIAIAIMSNLFMAR
jgi:hypothetical protein